MDIQELCGWNVEPDIGLDGFEIDLVGFSCSREVEHDDPNICPFNPGCGAKSYTECPLMKRRVMIVLGTHARQ